MTALGGAPARLRRAREVAAHVLGKRDGAPADRTCRPRRPVGCRALHAPRRPAVSLLLRYTPSAMSLPPLSLLETRILGVLVEKQHTVPDTYPLTLNALVVGLQPENEPRSGPRRERRRSAGRDRPPQGAVARRRVERRARDALRAERRARAGDPGAGGGAPDGHHAARAADGRASCASTASACIALPTFPPSRRFWPSSPRGRPARWWSSCRASPARARRAGRTCCRARPRLRPPPTQPIAERGTRHGERARRAAGQCDPAAGRGARRSRSSTDRSPAVKLTSRRLRHTCSPVHAKCR